MKSDFVLELIKADWEERKSRIKETGKLEVGDLLTNSVITINGELGDIRSDLREIKEQMVTKNFLGAVVTISIAIMGIVFAGLQLLI